MQIHCPCCHADFALEAALESDAGRELVNTLTQNAQLARPLVAYLGLYRSKSRALSFDRAARLAAEVLAMHPNPAVLAEALAETTRALREKQAPGTEWKPLGGHGYLKKVIEGVAEKAGAGALALPGPSATGAGNPRPRPQSGRGKTLEAMEEAGNAYT